MDSSTPIRFCMLLVRMISGFTNNIFRIDYFKKCHGLSTRNIGLVSSSYCDERETSRGQYDSVSGREIEGCGSRKDWWPTISFYQMGFPRMTCLPVPAICFCMVQDGARTSDVEHDLRVAQSFLPRRAVIHSFILRSLER